MLKLICLFCLQNPLGPGWPPRCPKGATEVPHGTSRQPQGSHRGAPWDLQAAPREPQRCPMGPAGSPREPQRCPMGPPGSSKGAREVLHGTSRQPQAASREPQSCPMGPPRSSKGATGVPQGTPRQSQGSHRGPKGATRSCKWYLWESESGCLILGVQVQDSESGRENLGVQSWESLMSDSVSPNMPDRIWCPNQSLTIDSMFLLFGVSRWGHCKKENMWGPPFCPLPEISDERSPPERWEMV